MPGRSGALNRHARGSAAPRRWNFAMSARLIHIAIGIGGYMAWRVLVRLRLIRARTSPAERLRSTLEDLGTSFVKLGQMLSIRRDLLPEAYVVALEGLQDRVPPFDAGLARQEVARALGRPVDELFARFEAVPLAAASIAQVHAAQTRDGREVVVKVRRPGIEVQVVTDMRLLHILLRGLNLLFPGLRRHRPLELLAELQRNLLGELDLRREARNIRRFSAAFDSSATVYVPDVVDDLYAESVLVQVRSGGAHVGEARPAEQGCALAQNLIEAYLKQVFELGFFHGDPHPGNLFIMEDGRICFHDFGLVGFIDPLTRNALAGVVQALVHTDPDWLLDAYLELGLIAGEVDRPAFRQALDELLREYAALPLSEWSFAEAFARLARVGRGHNIRLPHNLLVLMRTVFLMEATVRVLDPNHALLDSLVTRSAELGHAAFHEHWLEPRLRYEAAMLAQALPLTLARMARALRRDPDAFVERGAAGERDRPLDPALRRIGLAVLAAGLFVSASMVLQGSDGPALGGVPMFAIALYLAGAWLGLKLLR